MALENLKIIRLEAENVKRLKAVEITPTGDLVEIVGKNAQGKTSVLDSILWALGGEKPIQWKPIREGEERAHIVVDLGNEDGLQLRVTRRFTAIEGGNFSTTLKLELADGTRPRGEQTLLNTIIGALSFDPSSFIRSKAEDQVRLLKSLIPKVDFDAIARRRKAAYEARTDVNRDERRLRSAGGLILVGEDVPDSELDTAPLLEKIRNAGAESTTYHAEVTRREGLERALGDLDSEISDLENDLDELRLQIENKKKAMAAVSLEMRGLPELEAPADTSDLSDQLFEMQNTNRQVMRKLERNKTIADADAKLAEAEKLTKEIEACDREVISAIERADLPVRGLEIRDDMVFLRGVPFNQASDAEQLRTSMAMGMAANPKLRVLRIRDGSLLDEDAMEIIREVAAEESFQIWIERVGTSGGPEAVIMENGEVRGA